MIVLEGVDRSGKTTQCVQLMNNLNNRGVKTEMMRFPDRTTPIGKMIDAYLQNKSNMEDHALHLLFSANRWEARDAMVQKLQSGITLIVDRYTYSGVVFSAQKGLDVQWCKNPDAGLPRPDAVLFLTLPIEVSMSRGNFGNERYEKEETQRKVSSLFENVMREKDWKIIDATPTADKVEEQILKVVLEVVAKERKDEIDVISW